MFLRTSRPIAGLLLVIMFTVAGPTAAQVGPAPPPRPPTAPGANAKLATGTASIGGRVVAADTGRPLRRAHVRVSAPELGGTGKTTTTNIDGEYEVSDLPAGRYTISVTGGGYLPMQHGQRRFGEAPAPLQVDDGQAQKQIDFTLSRAGTISGRVGDETGQPVAGARVYAMQQQFSQGRRRYVPVGSPVIETDDSGYYRLQGVPPGDYIVMARSAEMWVADEDPNVTLGFAPSSYPGVDSPASAQPVRVGVAQDVSGIDFNMVPAPAVSVSGMAFGSDGTPLAGASILLRQEINRPGAMSRGTFDMVRTAGDGSWKLERVLPGEYTLRMTLTRRGAPPEAVTARLVVAGTEIEGVVLAADPGSVVTGTLEADHGLALPAESFRVVVTALDGTTSAAAGDDNGLVRADGTFSRRGPSGRVTLSVAPLPPGWAVKTVNIDGLDYGGEPIELRGGTRVEGVRVVLTNRFPTVSGQLTDDRGAPAEGTVILFPSDDAKWAPGTSFARAVRPDQSGVYRSGVLRPGEYLAVALDTVQPWQVGDPEFLETLRGDATRIRLQEGQTETLNLGVRR